ncbi:hypothetical protein [Armatimonas sp.]|uniref:hypothetical protein n=1 Tax=Armatimonas sp. TaxID=1872638 RepID=UPI0037507901
MNRTPLTLHLEEKPLPPEELQRRFNRATVLLRTGYRRWQAVQPPPPQPTHERTTR